MTDRIEQAAPDVREVLEAAIEEIMPAAPPRTGTDAQWYDWLKKRSRFRQLLDAEAHTDAALMLVPEGWFWAVGSDGGASVYSPEGHLWQAKDCATPALAIAAAASLRAKGPGHE